MMNIIDFVKEFEFKKRRKNAEGLGVGGVAKICSGGCEYMLTGVRKLRGARRAPLRSPGGCGRIAAPPLKPPLDINLQIVRPDFLIFIQS